MIAFDAPLIGPPLPRRDGPAKVTGAARYATDEMPPGLVHGVFAESAIAAGRIRAIDTAAARGVPGVPAVLTHETAPRLAEVGQQGQAGRPGQSHMPLQDDRIFHAGQYVALVVAETIEAAEHAAALVRVEYEPDPAGPRVRFEAHLEAAEVPPRIPLIGTPPVESCRGDPGAALSAAPVRLDLTYRTPVEHHAERFGWARRPAAARAQRDGRWLIGQGMATAVYPGKQSPASARVTLLPDGSAEVASATQEIGTGGSTALAMVAAAALGIPPDRVRFAYGDTRLPRAPASAGSQTTASLGSAIRLAAEAALLARHQGIPATAEATYEPPGPEARSEAPHAFGAQFCEVRVAEDSGEPRVARWTGAFACGRIVNARTAHSQLLGAIVWGIGMALLEETHLDARLGRFMNRNLAEYLVPVNADVPPIDAAFVPEADAAVNPIGAKNVGEIGICGAAAAIANAVYHATGRRIRDLPITPAALLA